MSRSDLVTSFKQSLMDVARSFTTPDDADFVRLLDIAARDMHRVRPRTLIGDVSLVAEQSEYAAPPDMIRFKSSLWGIVPDWRRAKPWEKTYPGLLPTARQVEIGGGRMISLSPAPSAFQIALLGSLYRFYYSARHCIGDAEADTTIHDEDRDLLILRAQAEAMNELAMRDSVRPVQIGGGHGGIAKTGMPTSLWEKLMASWLMNAPQ